jgi:hypothetical protein
MQVRREEGDSAVFEVSFSGTGSGDSNIQITWATGAIATVGTASAYDMGNGTYRIFMTTTRTSGNDLDISLFFHTSNANTKRVAIGEILIYQGTTEALFTEDDWLVQFSPMGTYGGIGDQSIAPGTGGASEWGTFLDDDDEADIATNQVGSRGTYKVTARYRDKDGPSTPLTLSVASTEEITIGSGDQWPTMLVSNTDMIAAGISDAPSLASHFHPKQLEFLVAKQGSLSNYGVPATAIVKARWSPYMLFDA